MTEAEARARLESMVQASSVPALERWEIDDLLVQARRADVDGLAPSDTGWTPTWHLASVAAEGWRRKAAKVVSEFDFVSDGQAMNRSQVHEMCMTMASAYRRGVVAGLPLVDTGDITDWTLVGNG